MKKILTKILWVVLSVLSMLFIGESIYFRKEIKNIIKSKFQSVQRNTKTTTKVNEFLNSETKPNSVIIFEPNAYHLECLPGYAKYFTDLGYNVDVFITEGCEESLEKFEPKEKLRIFTFPEWKELNSVTEQLSNKFEKYEYSLLHSSDIAKKEFIEKLGYLKNQKSLFVIHDTEAVGKLNLTEFNNKKRVFGLADYGEVNYVNPNYFGSISKHTKNHIPTFFITSTAGRNYLPIIKAVKKLSKQGVALKINVTGHSNNFSKGAIPDNLQKYFEFYGKVSYQKMYSIIENSDYIIVNLDSDIKEDILFKTKRATGSMQLAYGFAKPIIINEDFADTYKLSDKNSFIYKEDGLFSALKLAINLAPEKYHLMSQNMKDLCESIYNTSLNNVKKAINLS